MGKFLAKRISKISRRGWIRIITFWLVGNITSSIFTYMQVNAVNKYSRQLQYDYEQNLYSLSEYLGDIDEDLKISAYISTPAEFQRVSANVWQNCGSAKACIASLPTSLSQLDNTYRFLSQAGEYMRSLSTSFTAGNRLTADQRKTLKSYSDYASQLSMNISSLRDEIEVDDGFNGFAKLLTFGKPDEIEKNLFYTSLKSSEDSLKEIPDPTYDGPFSCHIVNGKAVYLENLEKVSKEDAQKRASELLGLDVSNLKYEGESSEEDRYSSYRYSFENGYIAMTVKGGLPVYFMKDVDSKSRILSVKECLASGERFLEKLDLGQFRAVYYETSDTVMTIDYCYLDGDTVCMTDCIKISVATDTGEIVSFDAGKFMLCHKNREEKKPKYKRESALSVLDPSLVVKGMATVILPCDKVEDNYCYEFLCKASNDTNVLVFISSDTLEEEKICIIDENTTGVYLI